MLPLNMGVLGVGHLGQHHARLYASLPETRLAGVFDTDSERAALVAGRHGCPVFSTPEALVAAVDAVSVAAPTTFHHRLAKLCLAQGKHVLVEKPIAVTVEEARDLVALARSKSCVLQVGHSERFNPIMLAVRDRIGAPGFIEAHRLGTYSERGTDVDVVLDLMIHDLDLVLSLVGSPVEEIRAAGVAVLSSRVDIANARLQFANGCVANLTASRISSAKMRRFRIYQQDGYVSIDLQARQAVVGHRTQLGEKPRLELEEFKGSDEEPLKLQLAAFAGAIDRREPAVVTGEAGTAALELAHRIREAIAGYWDGLQRAGRVPGRTS